MHALIIRCADNQSWQPVQFPRAGGRGDILCIAYRPIPAGIVASSHLARIAHHRQRVVGQRPLLRVHWFFDDIQSWSKKLSCSHLAIWIVAVNGRIEVYAVAYHLDLHATFAQTLPHILVIFHLHRVACAHHECNAAGIDNLPVVYSHLGLYCVVVGDYKFARVDCLCLPLRCYRQHKGHHGH